MFQRRNRGAFAVVVAGVLSVVAVAAPPTVTRLAKASAPDSPPLSPAAGLKSIRVPAGFVVEQMAAEPLVVDPVAFDWGPDGKLWVVEMHDYPLGLDGRWKPGGRVRYLEDIDGDGQYDRSTVFLDGLSHPNGVLPWRRGVLVTAAPEILYAEDTDGDGRADVRKTLYRGFRPGNPQLRINGLRYGLDNWVYCANGWSGGQVEAVAGVVMRGAGESFGKEPRDRRDGDKRKLSLEGRDIRIRPDTGELDAACGVSQYGRNRDDWGNWFGQNNSYPLWHYVLADHYARRNPHVPAADPIKQLVLPANPKVYPASKQEKRYHTLEQSGHFTSACSAMIYRDELLFRGERFNAAAGTGLDSPAVSSGTAAWPVQHAFTCEPFHNVVQHYVVEHDGPTFTAGRDGLGAAHDFFASTDRWCRPVMVRTGPDGALWIADMYRYMIEHPEYLTPDGRKELEPFYRLGDDRGRLYRVYPRDRPPRPISRLDRLSAAELVAALESPSGWQRDTAQMLLLQRNERSAAPQLERLARMSLSPTARLHALCALDGLNSLDPELLVAALSDPHPGVRLHAVRLSEQPAVHSPRLSAEVAARVADADAKVRLQLACSLGTWNDEAAHHALGTLLRRDGGDPFLAAAAISSLTEHNVASALRALLAPRHAPPPPPHLIAPVAATAIALGKTEAVVEAAAVVVQSADGTYQNWQLQAMTGLLDALARGKLPVSALVDAKTQPRPTQRQLETLFDHARRLVERESSSAQQRAAAIELVGHKHVVQEVDLVRLVQLLAPQTNFELQAMTVATLARSGHPRVPYLLLERWKSCSPTMQAQALDALLSRDAWCETLLAQVAEGRIAAGDLDATRRQRLLQHRRESIRQRAAAIFASDTIRGDRQRLVKDYESVVSTVGSAARGKQLFGKHCATCHQLDGQGFAVGPDLASLTDKSPRALLAAILDPNQSVEPRYRAFTVATRDGQSVSGLVKTETASSITLVGQDGKEHRLLRSELEAFQTSGQSLMPEGIERELAPAAMSDLLQYLREQLHGR